MSEKIRVLLVDDHVLFRGGVKALLQRHDDFEVLDEAGDGLEGIKRARSLKPDVVLLDLHMPGISGLEAVKVINEEIPGVRVLMLTVSEDAQDLMEALRAGARVHRGHLAGHRCHNVALHAAAVDECRDQLPGYHFVARGHPDAPDDPHIIDADLHVPAHRDEHPAAHHGLRRPAEEQP